MRSIIIILYLCACVYIHARTCAKIYYVNAPPEAYYKLAHKSKSRSARDFQRIFTISLLPYSRRELAYIIILLYGYNNKRIYRNINHNHTERETEREIECERGEKHDRDDRVAVAGGKF